MVLFIITSDFSNPLKEQFPIDRGSMQLSKSVFVLVIFLMLKIQALSVCWLCNCDCEFHDHIFHTAELRMLLTKGHFLLYISLHHPPCEAEFEHTDLCSSLSVAEEVSHFESVCYVLLYHGHFRSVDRSSSVSTSLF